MRRFQEYVSWVDIRSRYDAYEFRQSHGVDLGTFEHLVEKVHLTLRWLRGGSLHDVLVFGVSPRCFYRTIYSVIDAISVTHALPMGDAVAAARRGDTSRLRRWAEALIFLDQRRREV